MITDRSKLIELRDHRAQEMRGLRQRLAELVPGCGATHLLDHARRLFVLEFEHDVLSALASQAEHGEAAVKDCAHRLLLGACGSPIPERREGTERVLRILEGRV